MSDRYDEYTFEEVLYIRRCTSSGCPLVVPPFVSDGQTAKSPENGKEVSGINGHVELNGRNWPAVRDASHRPGFIEQDDTSLLSWVLRAIRGER